MYMETKRQYAHVPSTSSFINIRLEATCVDNFYKAGNSADLCRKLQNYMYEKKDGCYVEN